MGMFYILWQSQCGQTSLPEVKVPDLCQQALLKQIPGFVNTLLPRPFTTISYALTGFKGPDLKEVGCLSCLVSRLLRSGDAVRYSVWSGQDSAQRFHS